MLDDRSNYIRYGENAITESEWSSLGVREQERVKRASINNQMNANPNMPWNGYTFSPATMEAKNFRRSDWLRDKMYVAFFSTLPNVDICLTDHSDLKLL